MKGKIVVIIYALIIVLIISAIGALPSLFWNASFSNYLVTFFILTALQLFIGNLWNYFVDQKNKLQFEQVTVANKLTDSIQYLKTICAYCGTSNLVKIFINENNTYVCEACKQKNSIQIQTSSARITKPIMPKAELAEIFNKLDNKG